MFRIVCNSPADRPFAEVVRAFVSLVLPTRGAGVPLDDVLYVVDEVWNHYGPGVSGPPFRPEQFEDLTPAERDIAEVLQRARCEQFAEADFFIFSLDCHDEREDVVITCDAMRLLGHTIHPIELRALRDVLVPPQQN